LLSSIFEENLFMQAFLNDLILRPSCYQCVCKAGRSGADITMGDFWGIEKIRPELDDDKGCGLVLDYSNFNFSTFEVMTYENAKVENLSICGSVKSPINRDFFWHRLNRNHSLLRSCVDTLSLNIPVRVYRKLYRIFFK
jgi:hypothetical protein